MYYDGKEDLLLNLLQHLLQWLKPEEPDINEDSHDQLLKQISRLLDHTNNKVDRNGLIAVGLLRANSHQNISFQEEFVRIDTAYRNHFSTLIELGIEHNQYRDVDPEAVASYLYSTVLGEIMVSLTGVGIGHATSIEHEVR